MTDIYSFELETRKKGKVSLSAYKGKVMIIVNTATGCGFTPHYEPLENMYKKLHDKGLEIIDVPCNQF
jgi:glutathione peroxidase